jgi:hypothetical protein
MNIDELLEDLLQACSQSHVSRPKIKQAMEAVLIWLTQNDTDANCRKVDLFVSIKMDKVLTEKLPEDIHDILFDMGGALHDTHSSLTIAENFLSTPKQLLDRARDLSE